MAATSVSFAAPHILRATRRVHRGYVVGALLMAVAVCPWPWQSHRWWPRWSPILAKGVATGGQRKSPPRV
jgi:hypothetical protein